MYLVLEKNSQIHVVTLIVTESFQCSYNRWFTESPFRQQPGLPDFSWYNKPKRGKYTNWPLNIPNDHDVNIPNDGKIYQMTTR
jgi:hypothetical protein